jgi:hypothetical protein
MRRLVSQGENQGRNVRGEMRLANRNLVMRHLTGDNIGRSPDPLHVLEKETYPQSQTSVSRQ